MCKDDVIDADLTMLCITGDILERVKAQDQQYQVFSWCDLIDPKRYRASVNLRYITADT